jgi:hypothetical protein
MGGARAAPARLFKRTLILDGSLPRPGRPPGIAAVRT